MSISANWGESKVLWSSKNGGFSSSILATEILSIIYLRVLNKAFGLFQGMRGEKKEVHWEIKKK